MKTFGWEELEKTENSKGIIFVFYKVDKYITLRHLVSKNQFWFRNTAPFNKNKEKWSSIKSGADSIKLRMSKIKAVNLRKKKENKRDSQYNQDFNPDVMFKLKLAEDYLAEGKTLSKVAKLVKLPYKTLKFYHRK